MIILLQRQCNVPDEYPWSSGHFFYTGVDMHGMLTHYGG